MFDRKASYLLAIAENKTLSKAAQSLYVSQPSLTKFLKNEEQSIGATLFNRLEGEYVPTYIGERYLEYAKRIVEAEVAWEAECSDLIRMEKGRLNIAVPVVRSRLLIPDSLTQFHSKYPGVKVQTFEASVAVENLLNTRMDIDLAIYNVQDEPKELDYEIIGESEIVLAVPSVFTKKLRPVLRDDFKYPWLDLSQIKTLPLILLDSRQTSSQLIERMLKDNNMLEQVWMRTRSSDVALSMAENGCGCTFAAEEYAIDKEVGDKVKLYSTGDAPTCTKLIAAFRFGQYLPSYIKDYIEILRITHENKRMR